MANYTLSGLKIGPNTYTIPTSSVKSYRFQGNTQAAPGSFGTTGVNISNLGCLDESGTSANLPDLRSYPTYPIRFQLTDSNAKVWDVYLAKVDVTSSSAYTLLFLADTWYIEVTYDSISHTIMGAKAYDLSSGSTPAQSDTLVIRCKNSQVGATYPAQSAMIYNYPVWQNNGTDSSKWTEIQECFATAGETKKHLVIQMCVIYQQNEYYYNFDVTMTTRRGSNYYGYFFMPDNSGSMAQQVACFQLTGTVGEVRFITPPSL